MTDDPPDPGRAAAPEDRPETGDDDAARAPGEELFTQFEVIRRVLDARSRAEADTTVIPAVPATPDGPAPMPASRSEADAAETADPVAEPRGGGRRMGLVAAVAALSVFVAGAGAATIYYAGNHRSTHPQTAVGTADAAASAVPTAQTLAIVSWVLSSVGPSEVVACDVSVCSLLRARGFPASSLVTVQSVADVEQADVVIATPLLRRQLGSAMSAVVSTEPLAVYGSGDARVEADAVALTGNAPYAADLASDRTDRRTAGSALLRNVHVTFAKPGSAQARALLSEGLIDTRVCTLLATLASAHTLVIAGFTPPGAGAGPDVPGSGVLISNIDGSPVSAAAAPVNAVLAEVHAQQSPYLALTAGVAAYDGSPALRIVFPQPGPLDLLGG